MWASENPGDRSASTENGTGASNGLSIEGRGLFFFPSWRRKENRRAYLTGVPSQVPPTFEWEKQRCPLESGVYFGYRVRKRPTFFVVLCLAFL